MKIAFVAALLTAATAASVIVGFDLYETGPPAAQETAGVPTAPGNTATN